MAGKGKLRRGAAAPLFHGVTMSAGSVLTFGQAVKIVPIAAAGDGLL